MIKAYNLVSVAPGKASEISNTIGKMDGIKSVEAVAGPYDLIIRIEVDSLEKLTTAVFGEIRSIRGVTSTTTLIVVKI